MEKIRYNGKQEEKDEKINSYSFGFVVCNGC